jgi:hypothetical protein
MGIDKESMCAVEHHDDNFPERKYTLVTCALNIQDTQLFQREASLTQIVGGGGEIYTMKLTQYPHSIACQTL